MPLPKDRLDAAREQVTNDPAVRAAREEDARTMRAQSERERPLREAVSEAHTEVWRVEAGRDTQTLKDLRALADGYTRAVGEVRDLGGAIELHARSHKTAVAAFGEAMRVFPADWVAASNQRTAITGAPVAKLSKTRAHYTDHRTHKTKQRVQESGIWTGQTTAEVHGLAIGADTKTVYADWEWIGENDPERAKRYRPATEPMWRRKEYEVADYWATQDLPDGVPPRGRGWEQFEDKERGHTYWRRPKYRMQTVETEAAPEITTNDGAAHAAGLSGTFATCVHESSHRFESTVPGIMAVEAEFVRRRATTEDGLAPLRPLYAGRSRAEVARDGGFVSKYVGKEYTSGHREVLSVGMESIFAGEYGGLVGVAGRAPDLEHRAFVLGALAGIGPRTEHRHHTR